jgi:hypothetical protein
MFDSLDAFRAHCGEPTMELERCSICSAIPDHCYRDWVSSLVSDYDVDYGDEGAAHKTSDIPPQVEQLEKLIAGPVLDYDALFRCPTCRRLYLYRNKYDHIGARTYSTATYDRLDADTIFRTQWAVSRRLPGREVDAVRDHGIFRHHVIVRFEGARPWFSLGDHNQLVELSGDTLPRLTASDPPRLDDAARARAFAEIVGEVDDPEIRIVDSVDAIHWRQPVTSEVQAQIDEVRAATRIDAPTAERAADDIVVRLWIVSQQRLICRIVTVRETGTLREDAVIVENLPVVVE